MSALATVSLQPSNIQGILYMRKHIFQPYASDSLPIDRWLDLEHVAETELTSENAAYPIEAALLVGGNTGWRAAETGTQTIRILFDEPQRLRRIWLHFIETGVERTQEFALRWSPNRGQSFQDVVRQQYTFSPLGATNEVEDLHVDLRGVTTLELTIMPDQGHGQAYASLAQWRLA